jgi:putative PEP-CTERM system TPR-repeat lipoprotein
VPSNKSIIFLNHRRLLAVPEHTPAGDTISVSTISNLANLSLTFSLGFMNIKPICVAIFTVCLSVAACDRTLPADDAAKHARELIGKGELSTAEIQLKNAIQTSPNNPELRAGLAQVSLLQGRFQSAESDIKRAIADSKPGVKEIASYVLTLFEVLSASGENQKLFDETTVNLAKTDLDNEQRASTLIYLGRASSALGKVTDAKRRFEEALKLQPDSARAKANLIAIDVATSQSSVASKAAFNALLSSSPNVFEVQVLASYFYRADADLAKSKQAIRQAIELKPYDLDQRTSLIKTLIELRELDEANIEVLALSKLAPTRPFVGYLSSLVAFEQGDLAKAKENLIPVVEALPNFIPALELSANVALKVGDFVFAEKYASSIIEKDSKLISGPKFLASAQLAKNEPAKALATLRPLLQAKVEAPEILAIAGAAFLQTGDAKSGIAYLDSAVKNSANSVEFRIIAANARISAGLKDEGIALLDALAASKLPASTELSLARSYSNAKQYERALLSVDRFISNQPKDFSGPYLKGLINIEAGKKADARKAFTETITINPTYMPAVGSLAKLDFDEGKIAEAKSRYTAVLTANPLDSNSYLSLARIGIAAKDSDSDIQANFKKARELAPNSIMVARELAAYLTTRGDTQGAVETLQAAIQTNPNDTALPLLLARILETEGFVNKAVPVLEKASAANPSNMTFLMQLGALRTQMSDYSGAITNFEQAQKLQPGTLEPQAGIAQAQFRAGKKAEAIATAKAMKTNAPNSALGSMVLGDLLDATGQQSEALAEYRNAFKVKRNTASADKLHAALLANNKADEAKNLANSWWEDSRQTDLVFMLNVSDRHITRKEWKEANSVLDGILKVKPDMAGALNNKAVALHSMKDAGALHFAERALKLEPKNFAILDTRGWILVDAGKVELGMQDLNAALALAPKNPDVNAHLATGYTKLGDVKQARAAANVALANNPSTFVKEELLRNVK